MKVISEGKHYRVEELSVQQLVNLQIGVEHYQAELLDRLQRPGDPGVTAKLEEIHHQNCCILKALDNVVYITGREVSDE